jgi:hypothetical protein
MHRKPRTDIIKLLSSAALDAMDGSGTDPSPAEILSACFTLTSNVCKAILSECEKTELDHNIDQIQNAIGSLFALLPDRTKH